MLNTFTRDDEQRPHSFNGEPCIVTTKGTKCWYLHGNLHRTNGPAIIFSQGDIEWWINGVDVSDKVKKWAEDNNRDCTNMSDDDITFMWFSLGLKYDENDKPVFTQI